MWERDDIVKAMLAFRGGATKITLRLSAFSCIPLFLDQWRADLLFRHLDEFVLAGASHGFSPRSCDITKTLTSFHYYGRQSEPWKNLMGSH